MVGCYSLGYIVDLQPASLYVQIAVANEFWVGFVCKTETVMILPLLCGCISLIGRVCKGAYILIYLNAKPGWSKAESKEEGSH